jgi:leucyl aminopeptidase (aminopeptidase T)
VIDAAFQRALLDTDYAALAASQVAFEAAAREAEIRVTTPAGTDLRFSIGDRPVNRQDGDASAARAARGVVLIDREIELPSGAIRVAPLEETVRGTIAFPPSQWDGQPVEGLVLELEAGRVVRVAARSGREAVVAEMDAAGAAGRSFRELALGFNPLLAVPAREPWVPYYGYGAGVVRLSLGDNSELGGRVGGGYVRWNFFVDATVRVGDQVWVEDGRLVR